MYTGRTIRGGMDTRREKRRKAFWFFIRLLLVLELLAAASFYIKRHTVVEVSKEAADGPPELEGDRSGEVFGIGIESRRPPVLVSQKNRDGNSRAVKLFLIFPG